MVYVGVDIGKEKHAIAAVDAAGSVLAAPRFINQDAAGFASLIAQLNDLGGPEGVLVAMEATGHYWKALRNELEAHGYRADTINPLITSREASADVRGRKTDKLDALAIARVARRGGYSAAPSRDAAYDALKSLVRQRRHLVRRRTEAKMRYSSCLDVAFSEAARTFEDIYSATALAVMKRFPSARLIAEADIRSLTATAAKASGGQLARAFADILRGAARCSVSRAIINEGEEFTITQLVDEIRVLDEQIRQVNERIEACDAPEAARLLQSIKGAGKILPRIIAAEIGDLARFAGPRMSSRVLAFAGCEPRVRESGSWRGQVKMSKRGNANFRHSLYLMAGTVRLNSPCFNVIYQSQIAKGKHHTVAMSHVMRKLIEVMCGMYKTGKLFIPPQTGVPACS